MKHLILKMGRKLKLFLPHCQSEGQFVQSQCDLIRVHFEGVSRFKKSI